MSNAARSLFVFGLYLFVVGPGFIFVPNLVLSLLGFPTTDEPWIRIIGLLVFVLGYYYVQAALHEHTPFFKATVHGRIAAAVGFVLFVILDLAGPMLLLFGAADFVGAIWTALALKNRAAVSRT